MAPLRATNLDLRARTEDLLCLSSISSLMESHTRRNRKPSQVVGASSRHRPLGHTQADRDELATPYSESATPCTLLVVTCHD